MAASSVLPSSLGFSFFASPPAAGASAAGAAAATATGAALTASSIFTSANAATSDLT